MAEKKIYGRTKFIFRGDTIENWEETNPILELKELVLILNENNQTTGFKIGDGVTDFKNLDTKTFENTIKLWQSNTEYEVGDVVIANLEEDLAIEDVLHHPNIPHRTIIAKCIRPHNSNRRFELTNGEFEDAWIVLQETKAYYDALGRGIHNTYTTKEELEEALKNIPTGEGVTVDQTYNPESENAQSGIAVAEGISKGIKDKISVWQPGIEYKKDDVVIGEISYDGFYYFQAVLTCNQTHTSESELHEDMRLNLYEDIRSGMWSPRPFISREAECDKEGNSIHETYATKDELAEAIGQALEGDY